MINEVCAEIAAGKSLRKACSELGYTESRIRVWLQEDKAFQAQYARAREDQADYYADEICEIADTEEDPNKARVRIDARKWVASKLKSKSYGDKVDTTVNGALTVNIVRFSDAGNQSAE